MLKVPEKTFIIAEIGVNHNGDVGIAKTLVDVAKAAGCDAVKFQVRTPHMHVRPDLWNAMRDTPWGMMTHIEYRQKIELGPREYQEITAHCAAKEILFSASPWDKNAADKVYALGASFFKIASASVTNLELLNHISRMGRPVIMSTGMSTLEQVRQAVLTLRSGNIPWLGILACTSKYPCPVDELHLERINSLKSEFPNAIVGYSGHEPGLWTTLCAVAMGARIIERHVTLDRTMKGSDHAASIEPHGLMKLVKEIRQFERARGSAEIGIRECEKADRDRLRFNPVVGSTQEPKL